MMIFDEEWNLMELLLGYCMDMEVSVFLLNLFFLRSFDFFLSL